LRKGTILWIPDSSRVENGPSISTPSLQKIIKKITAQWISVKIDWNILNTWENTLVNFFKNKTYNLINPLNETNIASITAFLSAWLKGLV
jgi:hypothetical protein